MVESNIGRRNMGNRVVKSWLRNNFGSVINTKIVVHRKNIINTDQRVVCIHWCARLVLL